jgi:hypothetical protein
LQYNSSHSSVPLTARNALFVVTKPRSTDLKYHLDPAAWVPQGKINAMKNCAHCNCDLTSLSGEVTV